MDKTEYEKPNKKRVVFFIRKFRNEKRIQVMKKEYTDFTTTRPDYPANKAGCPLFYPPEYGIQSDISRVI